MIRALLLTERIYLAKIIKNLTLLVNTREYVVSGKYGGHRLYTYPHLSSDYTNLVPFFKRTREKIVATTFDTAKSLSDIRFAYKSLQYMTFIILGYSYTLNRKLSYNYTYSNHLVISQTMDKLLQLDKKYKRLLSKKRRIITQMWLDEYTNYTFYSDIRKLITGYI